MSDALHTPLGGDRTIPVAPRMALLFSGLGVAAVAIASLLPLGALTYWLFVETSQVQQMMGLAPEFLPEITMGQRIAAAAVALVTTLPLAWGLARLRTCLASFAAGRPFASDGIAGLKDFALGGVLAALAQLVSHTLMGLVLTWTAVEGHRQLRISIDSDMMVLALFAGTVAALAWAMETAAALAEENSQFI